MTMVGEGEEIEDHQAPEIPEDVRLRRMIDTWITMYHRSLQLQPVRVENGYVLPPSAFGELRKMVEYAVSFHYQPVTNGPPDEIGRVYACPASIYSLSTFLRQEAPAEQIANFLTLDRDGAAVVLRDPKAQTFLLKMIRRRRKKTVMVSPYQAISHGEELPVAGREVLVYPALLMLSDLTAKPIKDPPDLIAASLQRAKRYVDHQASLIEQNISRLEKEHVIMLMRERQEMLKRDDKWVQ